MTLQELNDYIQDILDDADLQETCNFSMEKINHDAHLQTFGREEGDLVGDGVYYDEYGTIIAYLYGGLNGGGDWKDYLNGLITVLEGIEELPEVDLAYLVDMVNDCPDDVFYTRIAIRPVSEEAFEE